MSKLHLRYAAMNAGKSTQLLQIAANYEEQGRTVLLFTSASDDRAGQGVIASRLGISRRAETFTPETVFDGSLWASGAACILIDEGQFLHPEQVSQLHALAHEGSTPVIVYALRTDFTGRPFAGSSMLLALADTMEEIKTICSCGRKATMNIRVGSDGQRLRDGPVVLIGGNDRYRSVCGKCFLQ